jgi:GAF domain-containing protein
MNWQGGAMDANNVDPEIVLRDWRTKILNGFLTIVAVATSAGTVMTLLDAFSRPGQWPAVILYAILSLVLVVLAIFRKIDHRIRSWGILLVGYATGLAALATLGLGGSGRLYLLSMPIIALILLGVRSGTIISALSILTMAVFAMLAKYTTLLQPLISERNSLKFSDWLAEGSDTLMLITVVMVLLVLFYRFQERLIEQERRTQTDLRRAQALLEDEKASLGQKVQERTGELLQRNSELAILNGIGNAMSRTLDVKALTRIVGDKVREILDSDSALIMLLDRQTNLIHVPYEFDKNEGGYIDYVEPFPLGTGVSSKVITTGQPLMLGTLDGAYFPPEIIEKGSGFYSQSWLGVPIMANELVLGLVALSDARQHAFNNNHLRLLQTLSSNMGAALENARLFDETQRLFQAEQRAHEQAEILRSVAQALNRSLSLTDVFNLVLTEIQKVIPYDSAGIYQVDDNRREFVTGRGFTNLDDLIGVSFEFNQQDDEIGYQISQSLQPLILEDASEKYPQYFNTGSHAAAKIRSYMAVPIVLNEKLIGMITLDKEKPGFYKNQHARLAMAFAAQAATAINNASLFDEIINSVQAGLVLKLEFQTIIDLVGEKIREIFDAQAVLISLYKRETNEIDHRYLVERGQRLVIGKPVLVDKFRQRVVETHQPWLINQDYRQIAAEIGEETILEGEEPKSLLFAPMIVANEVTGIISLQNLDREGAFSESDVRLLSTIANSMSVALENARLFDETQRLLKETEQRNRELAIINNIQQGLASKLDPQAMIDLFGDELMRIFPPEERKAHNYSVFIALYDQQTKMIHFPYLIDGAGNHFMEPPTELGPGLTSAVIRSGQVLVLNTLDEQVSHGVIAFTKNKVHIDSQSWLGVPIRSSDRVIGVISMQDQRPNLFTESIVRLLSTQASSLGAALENARLFSETQQRAAELAIINSVQEGLASKLDIQAIYELIGEKVREVFNVQVVDIVVYDPTTNLISMPYSYEKDNRNTISPQEPYGFRLQVINSRASLLINQNFAEMASQCNNPVITGECPKSALFVPLLVDEKVRGIISIQDLERENAFSASDMRLLQTLANAMSVALENARLFDETQRLLKETEQRNRELAIINEIQQALASKLDLQAMINLFGDEIMRIFPPQEGKAHNYSVYIALYDPQTDIIQFPYLIDGTGNRFEEPPTELGPGLTSAVIRAGQPLVLKTLEEQTAHGAIAFTDDRVDMGSQSWLGVPIRSGDRVIVQDQRPNLFTESDVRLLSTLAASLGVALENARLFSETQQRAAELAIINSVQEGLASKLEMRGIYDLVGEKIREIFDANTVTLATFDLGKNLMHPHFAFEKGQRFFIEPIPIPEVWMDFIRRRQPILINTNLAEYVQRIDPNAKPLAGEMPKSALAVPLIMNGKIRGVISLQNIDRENAFSESDMRLLQTLANAMSVRWRMPASSMKPSVCSRKPNSAPPSWQSSTAYKLPLLPNWICRISMM